jgi:DNA-binding SARP family transcriptional activator
MTDFRLLGPLEAVAEDRRIPLPRGKPQALLARLLLDAGRVVAVEALLESLWERAPASAHKVLQGHVSQLRKAIGPDLIETRPPGYVLHVARESYDLGRFESLTEAAHATGDPAERVRLLGEALALWRGSALAEFRSEPFARTAARRLDELRLSALEQRLEAQLELGEDARLIGQLEDLVEQEPLREQPRRQLILALYRSGRQAEALGRYREGRRLLIGELGIEPSPSLQELERAILRQDPALDERRGRSTPSRGPIVCVGAAMAELLAPLCKDGRELILVEIAEDARGLADVAARLEQEREALAGRGVDVRLAAFTSTAPVVDLARLLTEQRAELAVVGRELAFRRGRASVPAMPCDLAVAARPELRFVPGQPVLVPFGGAPHEWAALELAAWIGRAHGLPLRLLGRAARAGRRDASRMLASASLALQRFAGTTAEPVLVPAGVEGILAQAGSVIVTSLPTDELDRTRAALVEGSSVPLLLVRGGLRPGGLAPERTLTSFSWSLGSGAGAL